MSHLVITRTATDRHPKHGQDELHVDGPAVIRILGVRGSNVKVGIEAPESTKALRGELVPDKPPTAA